MRSDSRSLSGGAGRIRLRLSPTGAPTVRPSRGCSGRSLYRLGAFLDPFKPAPVLYGAIAGSQPSKGRRLSEFSCSSYAASMPPCPPVGTAAARFGHVRRRTAAGRRGRSQLLGSVPTMYDAIIWMPR